MARRSAWLLFSLVLFAGGCGASAAEHAGAGSCAAELIWNGVTYQGTGTRTETIRTGRTLGHAKLPRCEEIESDSVRIRAIKGVDPALAVAAAGRGGIYVAPDVMNASASDLPPALLLLKEGRPCRGPEPVVVEGRWVGEADPRDGFSRIQLDADEGVGAARRYVGFTMDFKVDEQTAGLDSRREWRRLEYHDDRVRVVAACVEGDQPNETFLAQTITRLS